ncbi:MAG: hypothetical protein DME65_02600 [Verrucomicrobia bacterium]|nr:MAG: hypothetical protein DME65_02600 [Verrucomicrobiota bacterium]
MNDTKTDQPMMENIGGETRSDRPSSTEEVARDLEKRTRTTGKPADLEKPTPLFPENESTNLRNHWTEIQAAFVDEPRSAVEQADSLVADVIKRLASSFADERSKLEGQWGRGDDVSTEDLRIALQRYRAFFDRLLSV